MNDEQAKYAYEKIGEYREEAKKADRKAFWQLLVAEASVVLIAADAVATKVFNAIPRDIAIGAGVLLGLVTTTLFSEANRNNSKSNVAEGKADILEDQVNIADKGMPRVLK